MKLEYGSKSIEYDISSTPSYTKVTLINNDGARIPIRLPTSAIDLSNSDLFDLALQKLYEENFPQKAENDKFKAIDTKLEEITNSEQIRNDKFNIISKALEEFLTTDLIDLTEAVMDLQKQILELQTPLGESDSDAVEEFPESTE